MGSAFCIAAHPFHNFVKSLGPVAFITFNHNYVLRSLVDFFFKKKGKWWHCSFPQDLLLGFCLIMWTICQENGERSWKQTKLIYFPGLPTQPRHCMTNSGSFTPWRSTSISACNAGAGTCNATLTSSLYDSQRAPTAQTATEFLFYLFQRSLSEHA